MLPVDDAQPRLPFIPTPDVARLCTRLCTYRYHLALGMITSPFLADQILIPADRRLAAACTLAGLKYTRFVDDLAISSPYDLTQSGFASLVGKVLRAHGFALNAAKNVYGRLSEGAPITGISMKNEHPDVRREFLIEVERQIEDVASLAAGKEFFGPYYTRAQIIGRVRFICWVNPGRKRHLLCKLGTIRWDRAAEEAFARGLWVSKKRLVRSKTEALSVSS